MYLKVFFILIAIFIFSLSSIFAQKLGDFVVSSLSTIENTEIYSSLGYQIYILQVQIGEHQISNEIDLIQEDTLLLISALQDLSSYRILDAMQHSKNKSQVLINYLNSVESILYTTTAAKNQITFEMSAINSIISSCEHEKKGADKSYLNIITDTISNQQLESIVRLSQKSAACIASQNVLLNAKQELSNRLDTASIPLGEKYDYLISNKDLILTHFDLLDSDYLKDILDIQNSLKKGVY